jgi:hypothetical protein
VRDRDRPGPLDVATIVDQAPDVPAEIAVEERLESALGLRHSHALRL